MDLPKSSVTHLEQEDEAVAQKYKNRSVAEQQSFDMAWDLLMESRFNFLRCTICQNGNELRQFRQLVINCIMATDLGDKELKELRNARWEIAFTNAQDFSSSSALTASSKLKGNPADMIDIAGKEHRNAINQKATIVV